MDGFFTPEQILAANDGSLPSTIQGLNRFILKQGWRKTDRARQTSERGRGWHYHLSLLPEGVQERLCRQHGEAAEADTENRAQTPEELWSAYETLSRKHKDECRRRLALVLKVEALEATGESAYAARLTIATQCDVAAATLERWISRLNGVSRTDWLAALTPVYKPANTRADCHEQAYQVFKSDYLRLEEPSFSACYRRMRAASKKNGWSPVPSERALRRHLDQDVPVAVQMMARKGRDAVKALYPAQRRDRTTLHAMQAVNMDGHKIDVFVSIPGREKPVRLFLVTIQDLYSNKHLAWRLTEAENKETVRLVIGDMVERYGIPDEMVLDNGRSFASKWITGGVATRYRYKVRDEDPNGLLTTLGVKVHWTTPYSGQSKPIERSFRDLAEEIAKHPLCAGAYTGNRPENKPANYGTRAVPVDDFERHVNQQIRAWNARLGRNVPGANGRSFDQMFTDSLALPTTIVRVASEAQRALWLLAAERLRTRKGNGEIHFFDNRYWHPALTDHAGQHVILRFDPEKLHAGLRVYDLNDQLICYANCVANTGFFDVEAAQSQSRKRNAYIKNIKENMRLVREMTPGELGELYADGDPVDPVPQRERPAIPRLAVAQSMAQSTALAMQMVEEPTVLWDDEMEAGFARSLRLIEGGLRDE
ncbi:MAG: Mu transposase C-terminal domain-containing protein [Rhizobiales bacterium]|nr:Mu transposase C-terminal domain-containing protein [Hyphomicrobiales bacterium]